MDFNFEEVDLYQTLCVLCIEADLYPRDIVLCFVIIRINGHSFFNQFVMLYRFERYGH